MRPEFIRVVPAEVDRYGAHGAVLLAHIRFRCESDGPGRTTVEGARWWRVSHDDIAWETGLSVKGVKTGLARLGEAVAAEHFKPLSNRTLSYRVTTAQNGADLPLAENGQWADLPLSENGQSSAENGQSISPNRLLHLPKTADVLLTGEAREGEKARGQGRWYLPPFPETAPSKFCRDHPNGTDKGCGPCGASRREYEAWVDAAWPWLNKALRISENTKDEKQAKAIKNERCRLLTVLEDLSEKRPA